MVLQRVWTPSTLALCESAHDQVPGLEVIKLEYILRIKIKRYDWLLADMCPQAANHCAFLSLTMNSSFITARPAFLLCPSDFKKKLKLLTMGFDIYESVCLQFPVENAPTVKENKNITYLDILVFNVYG